MSTITKEQAEAAALWWAERIKAPTFDNLGSTRGKNAHETFVNSFASILAEKTAQANAAEGTQVTAFKEALVAGILNMGGHYPSLYCDYKPGPNVVRCRRSRRDRRVAVPVEDGDVVRGWARCGFLWIRLTENSNLSGGVQCLTTSPAGSSPRTTATPRRPRSSGTILMKGCGHRPTNGRPASPSTERKAAGLAIGPLGCRRTRMTSKKKGDGDERTHAEGR